MAVRGLEKVMLGKFLGNDRVYLMFYAYATARRDERPEENWQETARAFISRFHGIEKIVNEVTLVREAMRMTATLINDGLVCEKC